MRPMRARTGFAIALAALAAGCALVDPSAMPMGGSGIEGSGLAAKTHGSRFGGARTSADDAVVIEALAGEAFAGRGLSAGDRFAMDQTFELRSGEARLRVPGDLRYVVTGPARVRFVPADGQVAAWLESGVVQAPPAGRVLTPAGAALACEAAFRVSRDRSATTFDCSSGSLRWGADSGVRPIAGAGSIDETNRTLTVR